MSYGESVATDIADAGNAASSYAPCGKVVFGGIISPKSLLIL